MSLLTATGELISVNIGAADPWGDPPTGGLETVIFYMTYPTGTTKVNNALLFNHDHVQLRTSTTGGDGFQVRFIGDVGNASMNTGTITRATPAFIAATHAPGDQKLYVNPTGATPTVIASATVANTALVDHSGIMQLGDVAGTTIGGTPAHLLWHGVCIIKGKALTGAQLSAIYAGTAKPEDHAGEGVDIWFLPLGGNANSIADGNATDGWTNHAASNGDYGLNNAGSGVGPDLTISGTPEWDQFFYHRWTDIAFPSIGDAWSLHPSFAANRLLHQQRVGLILVGTNESLIQRCIDAAAGVFGARLSHLVVQLGGIGTHVPLGGDDIAARVTNWVTNQVNVKTAMFGESYYGYPVIDYQFDNEFQANDPLHNATESGQSFIRMEAYPRGAIVDLCWRQRQALRTALTTLEIDPDKIGSSMYVIPRAVSNVISTAQMDNAVALLNAAKIDATSLYNYYAQSIDNQSDTTRPLTTNDGYDEQYSTTGFVPGDPASNSSTNNTTLEETRVGNVITAHLTGGTLGNGTNRPYFGLQWSPLLFSTTGSTGGAELICSNYTGYATFKAWASRTNNPIFIWVDASSANKTAQFEFAMQRMGPSLVAGLAAGGWASLATNTLQRGSRSSRIGRSRTRRRV